MSGPVFATIPETIAMLNSYSRRTIIETLAEQRMTTGELQRFVAVKQPTLTYHMHLLQKAHMIACDWEEPGFHVNTEQIQLLSKYVNQFLMPRENRLHHMF
jgi:DNA-binding transcriptional ArsR family regulator